jgi:hypothetical protein
MYDEIFILRFTVDVPKVDAGSVGRVGPVELKGISAVLCAERAVPSRSAWPPLARRG